MFIRKLPPYLVFNAPEAEGTSTPPAEPAAPPAEPAAPAAPAGENPPAAEPPAGDTPPWGDDFDPEKAWKLVQNLRGDIANEKGKRDTAVQAAETAAMERAKQEAYREFGKQLGVVKDDEAPTVEGLSAALQDKDQTLTASQAANDALRIENAILRHASKHGGDADALTDSESFKSKLKALDSAADDYASQVEDLVKTSIENNPRFRKVQVAPQSGNGDPAPSGSPSGGQLTREQLAALSPEDRLKAAKEGRLNGLLGKN